MYTQILSKNELVINAEEEKGEGRKKMYKIDMVNTEKRKEKQELPTNTPASSKKQNKSEAKNQWKQSREN